MDGLRFGVFAFSLVRRGGPVAVSRLAQLLPEWPEKEIDRAEWALDKLRKPEMVGQFLEELRSSDEYERRIRRLTDSV